LTGQKKLLGWDWRPLNRSAAPSAYVSAYRFDCPRASFFTLRFFDPRAYSLGFLGACFLREVRFDFLRSSFVRLFVFAISYVVPEFSLIAKIPREQGDLSVWKLPLVFPLRP